MRLTLFRIGWAFLILAAYTYTSGLRAPALIAFVKDALIYVVVLVAVIYIPTRLGGYGHIFDAAQAKLSSPKGPFFSAPNASGSLRIYPTAADPLGRPGD